MGTGKTSWAIQYMNEHPEKHFLYITPTLDEVQRIQDGVTTGMICQPQYTSKKKIDNLYELLSTGKNVVFTHSLFLALTDKCLQVIQDIGYELLIDETVDVFTPYDIYPTDLRVYEQSGYLVSGEDNVLYWNFTEEAAKKSSYWQLVSIMKKGIIYKVTDASLVWTVDPKLFDPFSQIYVMTYMFESCMLAGYFKMFHIDYTVKSIRKNPEGKYEIVSYYDDRSNVKDLITIDMLQKNPRNQKSTTYSAGWYKELRTENKQRVKGAIRSYTEKHVGTRQSSVMWTAFKESSEKIRGRLPKKGFVPLNARGTNKYADKSLLVYPINIFINPSIRILLGRHDINIDSGQWALSQLLQWIWRSQIRNGKPIRIVMASVRMRKLLDAWIEGKLCVGENSCQADTE